MAQADVIFARKSYAMKYTRLCFTPHGLEDNLLSICKLYHGEGENPYEVDSPDQGERMIQFFKYHLFDAEKSLTENAAHWKFLLLQEKGGAYTSEDHLAKKMYEFVIGKKLSAMEESTGMDFKQVWKRFFPE